MTDFVVSTDLIVLGMSFFDGGQTFDGQTIIDVDDSEALLVRKNGDGGDVFIVDTVAPAIRLGTDARLDVQGVGPHALSGGGVGNVQVGISGEFTSAGGGQTPSSLAFDSVIVGNVSDARLEAMAIFTEIQVVTSGVVDDVSTLVLSETFTSITGGGSVTNEQNLLIERIGLAGDNTYGIRILTNDGGGSTAAIIVEADPLSGDGQLDSEAILLRGQSFAAATPHSIDWKFFVDVTANDGTGSLWTLQTRIDAGGFVTVLTVAESGNLTILPTTAQLILPSSNDATTPTLAFGDGDSGFYEQDANQIQVAIAGGSTVRFSGASMRSTTSSSWLLSHPIATLTGPVYTFQGDVNTGIGHDAGGDIITIIAGGTAIIQVAGTGEDFVQTRFQGAFTSDGGSNFAAGALFASDITSADGDTGLSYVKMGGSGGGSLTTPGTGTSLLAATLVLDEPNITLTGGDAMAIGATLFISGQPTEGTSNNYGIFNSAGMRTDGTSDFFGNITQPGASDNFTLGSGVPQTHARMAFIAAFVSTGISNHAEMLFLGGSVTGFNADTLSLAGLLADVSITTQGASNTIADVAQLILNEPDITIGAGDTVTNASTLAILGAPTEGVNNFALRVASGNVLLGGNLTVSGVGPHVFGGIPDGIHRMFFRGNFTSDGSNVFAALVEIEDRLTGAPGDFVGLFGVNVVVGITTQTAVENITDIASLRVLEPSIVDNLTGTITNASTLLVADAPTEGVNNFAIRVASGLSQFGGTVQGANGSSFALLNVTSTATVPTLIPNRASTTTGIGGVSGEIALIVSSTAGIKLRSGGRLTFGDVINQDSMYLNVGGIVVGGSGGESFGSRFHITKTAVAGSTSLLADFMLDGSVRTQTAAESIANIAFLNIEGDIQDNLTGGGLITVASALRIANPPTEGVTNFAINVVSGDVFLGGNLTVSGAGPHAIGGTPSGIIGLIISETFTSDGAATLASGVFITQTLVGASGDTTSLTGVTFISAITTQTETENIANISQVEINEPFISDNLTGDITNAQTLLIVNAPTEGLSNFAIRVISGDVSFGGNILVGGDGPHGYSSGITVDYSQSTFAGSFTSGGAFNQASGTLFSSTVTSDIGDGALAQVRMRGSLTTPGGGATPTVATLMLDEPVLTVGGGDAVGIAATLIINSAPTEGTANHALLVSGGGVRFNGTLDLRDDVFLSAGKTFTIGSGILQDFAQVALLGTFTSSGSSNKTASLQIQTTQTAVAGDTLLIAALNIEPLLVTQGATEGIANVASVIIDEPNITVGTGDTITNASTLLILGAPTEGNANWALRIVSGDVNFGGDLIDIGTGGGNIDILFRGCSTFFLGTLSSPEEMFFGVGSTVSVTDAAMSLAQNVRFRLKSTVGDFSEVKRNSFVVQLNVAAPSVTIAGAIPAGSFVFGITARVIGAITGPTGFDIGDGVDVDRWGNSISGSLGTTVDITDATDDTVTTFPTANDVVITSDGVDFSAGELRIVIHYLDLSAPTS